MKMNTKWIVALAACLAAAIFLVGFLAGRGERQIETVTVYVHDTTIMHEFIPPDTVCIVGIDTVYVTDTTSLGSIPIRTKSVTDSFRVSWEADGESHHQMLQIRSWVNYRGLLYAMGLDVPKDIVIVQSAAPRRDVLDFRLGLGVSIVPRVIPEANAEVILLDRVGAYGRVEYDDTWKYRAGVKFEIEL